MKKLTVIALLICVVLSLCACGSEAPATEAPETEAPVVETEAAVETTEEVAETEMAIPEGLVKYTVTVVDEAGNPIANAMVQLCKDSCVPGVTNESGEVYFVLVEDDYKASMMTMPEGYAYAGEAEEFYFEGASELTIVLKAA